MTSAELKNDKAVFISNIDSLIEKYNNILSKINSINISLSSSEDTIISNEIATKNENIITAINNVIAKISSEKQAAIPKIDNEIRRLEQLEEEMRQKSNDEDE